MQTDCRPICRVPFAVEPAGNQSVSRRREYSAINALLVQPSQEALANQSYAIPSGCPDLKSTR